MKKLFFLLILPSKLFAHCYYFSSSNGSDSHTSIQAQNQLMPWASVAKLNSFFRNLNPGDSVLFKSGDIWYGAWINLSRSGSVGLPIVIGSYGTGAKPVMYGSLHENKISDWTNIGGNVWQNNDAFFATSVGGYSTKDVGNIIFNGGAFCGVKLMTSAPTFTTQGQFWYDFTNNLVKMYSVGNPATFYTDIQCALKGDAFYGASGKSYIDVENLDFRYYGVCVFETSPNFSNFKYLDISFIGGADVGTSYAGRYGNGIQMWQGNHDISVYGCNISNVYDAGITPQGYWGGGGTCYNIYIHKNVVIKCEYSFEFYERDSYPCHDVYFENNTCINAGGGWSHGQRPDGLNGTQLRIALFTSTKQNIYIRNNIFYGATEWLFRMVDTNDVSGMTIDYNSYYLTGNEYFANCQGKYYPTFAIWQALTIQDRHSINVDPLFVKYPTNLSLQTGSPCIGTGTNTGHGANMGASPYH